MQIGEKPFLMVVEDVFCLHQGRVVMATGRIGRGRVRMGDEVEMVGSRGGAIAGVTGIEARGLRVDEASAGMNVGLLMPGAAGEAVERGQVVAAPGSIGAHIAFAADIALLSKEDGGAEVRNGEGLDFCIHAGRVRGIVTLPSETDALQPLHMAAVRVTLERTVALEVGLSFAFRHHGRAAGSGTVTQLLR